MSAVTLYILLLRATLLSFSGFASVPVVRENLVLNRAVLTDTQLNDAIAVSQASPGPLGLYVVVVGYDVAGVPGALAGVLSLITPALLAVPIGRLVWRGQAGALRGASTGIVLASCALMLATGVRLIPTATPTLPYVVLALAGFAALLLTKLKPVWVIVACVLCGLAL